MDPTISLSSLNVGRTGSSGPGPAYEIIPDVDNSIHFGGLGINL